MASPVAPALEEVVPPPPPIDPTPPWLRTTIAALPTPRLVGLAIAVGILGDLAARSGVAGFAGALLIAGASAALLVSGRLTTTASRVLVAAAPAFGIFLALRMSPWLVPLDIVAAGALLVAGASVARRASLLELPVVGVAARSVHAFLHVASAPAFLRPLLAGRVRTTSGLAAVARGAGVAVPVVLLFGLLLASADAVFASFVRVDIGDGTLHVALIAAFAWLALGLLRTASAAPPAPLPTGTVRTGRTEVTVVLGAVAVLFGLFAIAQLIGAGGGADHVLQTAGLTRAEYARSGFFQLLWVAGLTMAGLATLTPTTDVREPGARVLRGLVVVVVALAVAIVAVAVVRLDLYRDAYGWTMLRLYCTVFAVWLGVVLVLLGASLAGPPAVRRPGWFTPAAIAAGLVVLFALNVVNPEARVAEHNLSQLADVGIDPAYLGELSDDAVPTIVRLLPTLDPATRDAVVAAIGCDLGGRALDDGGWAAWNRARANADDARRTICTT